MEVMSLLKPHQVQLTQAMHLFITTKGSPTIGGRALGDDDQTPQARTTQAVWINTTADTDIAVDSYPEWTGVHATLHCPENDPTLTNWRTRWAAEVRFGIGFKKINQFFPIVLQKITDCSDYCPFK